MQLSSIAGWLSVVGLVAAAEYDYIIVGGGPAGLIAAERLTAANNSVLLLERGQGPTVDTGSNATLPWSDELTPIDVPGLSASVGMTDLWGQYMCTDTPMSACVLGGGTTINYLVFVHPSDHDFNDKFPEGWKWADIEPAAERLYSRNAGTTLPSSDGKLYAQGLYNSLSKVLDRFGFRSVDMIEQPNEKSEVYSHPAWNIGEQKRAGPVRSYLPLAQESGNLELRLNSKVIRVVREGSKATGVEVETDGSTEIVSIKPTGRVVLAAGALSSPRILWNSGIGRAAQIETAASSGIRVPARNEWIDLPVGEGLMDHPIFSLEIKTNETFGPLDGAAILDGTADNEDIAAYLNGHSGPLTEGKHQLIFFTSREGEDGQTRYFQGSCGAEDEGVFSIKIYLTHGLTSSGALSLNETDQSTYISETPYLTDEADKKAAWDFLTEMINKLLSRGTGYSFTSPTNVSSIIENYSHGNHFVGSTKMGTDSGLEDGTAVVDLDTKVYGTDNLFVVDAGIHPDLATGNIQATVMVVAEAAVARILALEQSSGHTSSENHRKGRWSKA